MSIESSNVVIDENGDTILVLENPLESLDAWPRSVHYIELYSDSDIEFQDVVDNGTPADTPPPDTPMSASSSDSTPSPGLRTPSIRYQVSSFMLKCASQYFRNMFSGGFCEAVVDADGKYHIQAQGFHPKALEHVLNIVHLRTRQLPQVLDLKLLVQVAVLVDYYSLHEAVGFHGLTWSKTAAGLEPLDEHVRDWREYSTEVTLKTFVAKVFGDENNFVRGVWVLAKHSNGPIADLGLPLPDVPGVVDELRQKMINAVLKKVKELPQDLLHRDLACSDLCRSLLLGNFMLRWHSHYFEGRLYVDLEPPFKDLSFWQLRSFVVQAFDVSTHCTEFEDPCSLEFFLESAVEAGDKVLDRFAKERSCTT